MEKLKYYSAPLMRRFISDNKLPIPMFDDEQMFIYYLNLYNKDTGCKFKYDNLCDEIERDFCGDIELFLWTYLNVREEVINHIKDNLAFKEFNLCDMNKRFLLEKDDIIKGDIYNQEYVGKYFISVDLREANLQALRYADPLILDEAESWYDFMMQFTNSEYIRRSKYLRNVVMGQCNPSRHITVEKRIIHSLIEAWKKHFDNGTCHIARKNTDEIIFMVDKHENGDDWDAAIQSIDNLIHYAQVEMNVALKKSIFLLKSAQLVSTVNGVERNPFYIKGHMFGIDDRDELVATPLAYHALCYKLTHGLEVTEQDYLILYEGLTCKIMDNFTLKHLGE